MNLYATPYEVKSQLGDGISQDITKYDQAIIKMLASVSRLIDLLTAREFYPSFEVRYFQGSGFSRQWIDDCLEITEAYYSEDSGQSYVPYNLTTDFIKTRAGNYNSPKSYDYLIGNVQSARGYFPPGQRSIKIKGWWGYNEDRRQAWQAGGQVKSFIQTTSTNFQALFGDMNPWGLDQGLLVGQTIRIDDEILFVNGINSGTSYVSVNRAMNGSEAGEHMINSTFDYYQPSRIASEAAIMQAVRTINRAWQGFADGRSSADLAGQIMWVKKLDPEVTTLLMGLVKAL